MFQRKSTSSVGGGCEGKVEPPSEYLQMTENKGQDRGEGGLRLRPGRGSSRETQMPPKGYNFHFPQCPSSSAACIREQHPQPTGAGTVRKSGHHRRNDHALTNMGTGLCCPHAANTGGQRIPADQGGAPAQAPPT